jgi:hypothetical protein
MILPALKGLVVYFTTKHSRQGGFEAGNNTDEKGQGDPDFAIIAALLGAQADI